MMIRSELKEIKRRKEKESEVNTRIENAEIKIGKEKEKKGIERKDEIEERREKEIASEIENKEIDERRKAKIDTRSVKGNERGKGIHTSVTKKEVESAEIKIGIGKESERKKRDKTSGRQTVNPLMI